MLIRKSFTIIVDQVAVPSGSEDLSIVAVDLSAGMFSHVKHGARCAMGKVGEDNKPKKGRGISMYHRQHGSADLL